MNHPEPSPPATAGGPAPRVWLDRMGRVYEPAVGPKLRLLLALIFASVALLGASGFYLLAIRVVDMTSGQTLTGFFSLGMTLFHVLLGVAIIVPFVWFGFAHFYSARHRRNRRAVKLGIVLFITGTLVCLTGLALIQLEGLPQLGEGSIGRWIVLALHILTPVAAVAVYVMHRRAGPDINWRWGISWGAAVGVFTVAMIYLHSLDPRQWHAKGSPEGEKYFEPSRARTTKGDFIPAGVLMMDEYCLKCHADIYDSHIHSVHKFSSFNNQAYFFSVKETRERMGTRASRWCAGCHDPVPFFSGQFDDEKYDMVNHPTAKAGITCTVCHAMTHVNSRSGNADYTIEEPIHYPFARSDNPVLQWLNNQLVKAKPDFHKKTFLKPFHRSAEFCSTCHKVGLPQEVNHYKEFLLGQDHPVSYHLSGVSGHGARSWYYPEVSKNRCADCHMPLVPSNDLGRRDFDKSGIGKVHSHLFTGANTGVPTLGKFPGYENVIEAHRKFLTEGLDGKSPALRLDVFGLKKLEGEQTVDAPLIDDEPLRPKLPKLQPGVAYLAEVVIRTLNLGHHFTQGTADSNEVWVEFVARSGDRIIGRSGGMESEDAGRVDPWSHFLNVFMLDRHGNRVDRRNPQDIFTPLYDHQIPPGAAQVVHFRFRVPPDVTEPIELSARLRYRKFDYTYMEKVLGAGKVVKLPIIDLCSDKVVLPLSGGTSVPGQTSPIPSWQRWNDYGIGCFLEGGPEGKNGGELAQAEHCFQRLVSPELKDVKIAHGHGHMNLARVHLAYGGPARLEKARLAVMQARKADPPAPWWTLSWLSGRINLQNGNPDEAIASFKRVLDPANRNPARNHDFSGDFVVRNELGIALFSRAQLEQDDKQEAEKFLRHAITAFEQTLALHAEDVIAHDYLKKCFERLAESGTDAPLGPVLLPEERHLLDLTTELSRTQQPAQARVETARQLARVLAAEQMTIDLPALLAIRKQCLTLSASTHDVGLRLLVGQSLASLDRHLLAGLDKLGSSMARRQENEPWQADRLAAVLAQLAIKPAPVNARPLLGFAAQFPVPGLPVNVALEGLAVGGYLQGPLPPPRTLAMQSLRHKIRPMFDHEDAKWRAAAALVLARIHHIYHGIYRVDDNAQGQALAAARQRYPAADRASHPIVIYDLHPRQTGN